MSKHRITPAVRTRLVRVLRPAQIMVASSALLVAQTPGLVGCQGEPDAEPMQEAPAEFRAGANAAQVAAEVAQLRAQPLVLGASAPLGTLPGAPAVSATGEASYEIPLEVTPGPRGMQPELSVVYRSNGDDGILGPRFDLTGASAIVRCPGSIAQDGAWRPVAFTDADALCLGGTRLLLHSGVHGQAGAEYRASETPFDRIVLDDPIDTLGGTVTVWAADGRILTYGTAAASLWIGNTLGQLIPWQWSLLQQCDRWDNCLDYEYEHGSDHGRGPVELRRTAIRYGGTGPLATRRAVELDYVARTDTSLGWTFGAQQQVERLLSTITVLGPGGVVVRRYEFDYVLTDAQKNRLSGLRLCDAAGVCLPATTFGWSADASSELAAVDWAARWNPDGTRTSPSEFQAALLGARESITGDFDGDGSEEFLLEGDDPAWPWTVWTLDLQQQNTQIPDLSGILPPPPVIEGPPGDPTGGLSRSQPRFRPWTIDFNGDPLDDVIFPVRGGWPSVSGGVDGDGHAYADSLVVLLSLGADPEVGPGGEPGPSWMLHYLDDGSDEHIYQMVALDHDGDQFEDLWLCRGPRFNDATWVLGHHVGQADVEFGYTYYDTGIGCSAYDETSAASTDGGPAGLLVIPAFESPGDWPPLEVAQRGAYQRVRLDLATQEAWLESVGLPRDAYQRTHDLHCVNGAAVTAGYGPVLSAGFGLDKQIDLNGDGLGDILRFELAGGDGADTPDLYDGMPAQLPQDWQPGDMLCGPGNDLDAVIAIYYNTGAGFVRGPDAMALSGNGHAQLWLNFVGAQPFDLDDDGRVELMMPGRGPDDSGWVALGVAPGGAPRVTELSVGQGWPAYDDDDAWLDALSTFEHTRIAALGRPERPALLFLGLIEDAPDFPYAINAFVPDDADARSRVTSVVDGLQDRTEFHYASHNPELIPSPYPSKRMPQRLWVVDRMERTTDADDPELTHQSRYGYSGGRMDRLGRGFLGFAEVTETHDGSGEGTDGRATWTRYDQSFDPTIADYPRRGKALEQVEMTYVRSAPAGGSGDGTHVEQRLWDWTVVTQPVGTRLARFTYASSKQSRSWLRQQAPCLVFADLGSNECRSFLVDDPHLAYRREATTETRDAFGTLLEGSTSVDGGQAAVVTQTEIVHDQVGWLLGMVGRTEVRDCREGQCATRVTAKTFDLVHGDVAQAWIAPDDPQLELRAVYTRDPHGNVARVDQYGAAASLGTTHRVEQTTWDAEGVFPRDHTNALGHVAYSIHDPASGVLVAQVDPAGLTQRYSYDGLYRSSGHALHSTPMGPHDGAPTTISRLPPSLPDGRLIVETSTLHGQRLREQIGATGDVIERRWLGMSPIEAGTPDVILAGGEVVQTFRYDRHGREIAQSVPRFDGTPPLGETVRSFDGLGRETSQTAPDGTVLVRRRYQHAHTGIAAATRVFTTRSQGGADIETWLDLAPDGHPELERDATGVQTCFHHGAFGVLTSVVRDCGGANVQSTTSFDALGHVLVQTDPQVGTRTSHWNGYGELVDTTDGAGAAVSYRYDMLGRLTERQSPEGSATFSYDLERLGALAVSSSPDLVTTDYDVDDFGRIWRQTTSMATYSGVDDYGVVSTFGPGGRLETLSYPTPDGEAAVTTRMIYDEAGYHRMVKESGTGALLWIVRSGTPTAQPVFEEYGNGVMTQRDYDPLRGWVERIHSWKSDAAGYLDLQDLQYAWTPQAELSSRTDALTSQSETLGYDTRWQLTSATVDRPGSHSVRTFGYDAFRNLTSMTGGSTYGYDAQGRLTTVDGQAVGYDGAGRVTSIAGRTSTYTSWSKPRQITRGTASLSMLYDADGERVRRRDSAGVDTVTLGSLYERKLSSNGTTRSITRRVSAGGRVVAQIVPWGDTVRVKAGAQPERRPGAIAEVVGIREIEAAEQARQFDAPIGSTLYLIEFGDGTSIEIPKAWVEAASSS
jgi:YD repeat-containing protein